MIVDGKPDENGGALKALSDGRLPEEEDEPLENFFFAAGTDGGRLLADLGAEVEVREINSFSWHPGSRGPQVYTLYAADSSSVAPPDLHLKRGKDPLTAGWKLIAKVDARTNASDSLGGQYGVHISEAGGNLGKFRYLLFDILPTETLDAFGNTFYSEIDVVDSSRPVLVDGETVATCRETLTITNHSLFQITVDTCDTTDLQDWTRTSLDPVLREWYPKLVEMLPSDRFEAPKEVAIRFSETLRGVAETSGTRVRCAAKWFRANLQGEAVGSVVHELVHVVQQYGNTRRTNPEATRAPGWLVEGLADYIRWFLYEPQSHGADMVWLRQRRNIQLRYDAGYRVTANFLNWATQYDKDLIRRLNAAMREGRYREDLWKDYTGHSLSELGANWKKEATQQLAPSEVEPQRK
jgi:hypothetical protein